MTAIEMIIEPRTRDLGGFTVGRVLPYAKRRTVGPFIFFDEMGPAQFEPGTGIDVRPHPHIGLATVTYLFSGEIRHKDDLGYDQVIRPGDVNWMTAGRGIVHSERTDDALRQSGQHMHGIQSWVALPKEFEETEPSFHHHPKATLPVIERDGVSMRLIAGSAYGEKSPVKTFSPIFYLGVEASAGTDIPLTDEYQERAIYVLSGRVELDGEAHDAGRMIVFTDGAAPQIKAIEDVKVMLLGGAPIGKRHIWWNLVSSDQQRIEKAKADWKASADANFEDSVFSLPPDEREHIPLPEG
ncbi:pirin family protein [Hyphococcus flavus]|uniref:Pirin family protein n=1 Tax=Hyphococcus flavus TaxID=1866326 RepID=A0AAE9ZEY3_9PROT|nr:pirin family protein [Hyphococcus flavus]WDI31427.1 pirin family protein [Hyphococcus flavus]